MHLILRVILSETNNFLLTLVHNIIQPKFEVLGPLTDWQLINNHSVVLIFINVNVP